MRASNLYPVDVSGSSRYAVAAARGVRSIVGGVFALALAPTASGCAARLVLPGAEDDSSVIVGDADSASNGETPTDSVLVDSETIDTSRTDTHSTDTVAVDIGIDSAEAAHDARQDGEADTMRVDSGVDVVVRDTSDGDVSRDVAVVDTFVVDDADVSDSIDSREVSTDGMMDGPTDVSVLCAETGARIFGGHCYFLSASLSYSDAKAECATSGAHLVTITSSDEQDVAQALGSADRWIGLERPEGSTPTKSAFKWITGEAITYERWGSGEPNGSGRFGRLKSDGRWADWAGTDKFRGICERE